MLGTTKCIIGTVRYPNRCFHVFPKRLLQLVSIEWMSGWVESIWFMWRLPNSAQSLHSSNVDINSDSIVRIEFGVIAKVMTRNDLNITQFDTRTKYGNKTGGTNEYICLISDFIQISGNNVWKLSEFLANKR